MATIYIDIPASAPDSIIVRQADTIDGTKTEVINSAYGAFPTANGKVTITDVNLDADLYSFVSFVYSGVESDALVIKPVGFLDITLETLFNKIVPRLRTEPPVRDFLTTVAHVVDAIDRRLHVLQSDLLQYDYSDALVATEYQSKLPYGFLGIVDRPWVSHADQTKKVLYPLPNGVRGTYTENGVPEYYDIRGGSINLYPTCDRDVTLHYLAYVKAKVDEITDPIPYNGLFNDTITELVVKFGADPTNIVQPALEAMVYTAIDRTVVRRSPKNIYFRQMKYGRVI